MLYTDAEKLKLPLTKVIQANVSAEFWDWLQEKIANIENVSIFNASFTVLPRKSGKAIINISEQQSDLIFSACNRFSVTGWTIDRLCRVYLLFNLNTADKDQYFKTIETLFSAAEMSEQVALYSALPLLNYPEIWKKRCAEGIRSNIGLVLEAIMYHNPYPAQYLDEAAWNQLVLKAFFTDKQVELITGIDERANQELAYILSDYAHERWAAGRTVNFQLWRLVGKFIDERLFNDITKVLHQGDEIEQKAAALAIWQSDYKPAKDLLNEYPDLKHLSENNTLTWQSLVETSRALIN
jgi:hypothetical protein